MLAKDNKVLEYYNKNHNSKGHGTLMANWWEEQVLREETQVGRTCYPRHHTKARQALYTKPPAELVLQQKADVDSTYDRTLGKEKYTEYSLTSQTFGSQQCPPRQPNLGPRDTLMEKHLREIAERELDEKDRQLQQEASQQFHQTLYRQDFHDKDLKANTIGRKVMKTQDLKDL